uniref:Galectin 4 n=1 Tax=Cyprinus carpio carpio TaxID=630221 RepID=A0A9J8C095_CYPCA
MPIFLCLLQNLPYVAPISGGLREGMALYLKGVVPTNADQFEINFKTGPSSNDDMAFQFNPRMDQKVAMNSVINGSWGTEESVSDNPFKKGEAFEMFSVIKSEGFQVYVNGKELYTFKHRIPLEKVSTLNINGDVAVNLSGFLQNLPYVAPISGGLREGMALYLQGVVPTDADQFEINFKTGPSSNDDMAFQFKPRMDQKVAMNSIINGSWGTEESLGPCPHMGCVASIHQVYVNGKELYTFKHRIPLEKVSTLNISGDVAVNLSGFLQNWSASVFPTEVTTKITTLGTSHGGVSTVQSEILQPVQNPNLPYVAPISGGLREGMALYLQGVVPTNADQFEINFKTGPSSNDDMAFQFNPRMDQKVAMNSVINGSWGTEESVSDNPFKKGEAFEMFSVIKSEGFQVYVNGKELYTFKHRIPLEKVSTLNISGDVAVNLSEILQPVQNPNLPYVAPISGGLREGMALYLQGVVPTNADQFVINFKTGQSSNEDKAFHFNPRMDKKVAMNSVINGIWGTEESVSENPFKKGEAFEMFSVIKSEGYQVYVNGKEMYTFKHRIPLEKVSTLNISGDVAVKLSGFIQNWSASVFPTEVITKITTLGSSHGAHSTVQSEILQPVQNPNLPYVAPISGGLREGMALYLKGVVPTNADQFEINFKTGPSSNDDMAFQFKPRMDQKLAMNSIINGSWGTEESVSDNPFKKGEAFEMFTVIKSEGYQVYVNGKELYTFKHRIPLEKVSTLNINGDVAVNLSEILQPVQNPNLPYVAPISGGLREGMALYLQGVVPTNADQFEINFKTGPSSNDDMAFQFNPRMDQKVAMNSVINGSWGTEESVSDNPFKKGEAFEMFSVIKSEGFQVYVNGKELYTFKHRIPLEKVSTLNINGDVAVNLSGVLQNWSASVSPTEVITKITTMCSSHGAHSTVQSEILQPVQNPNLPYVAPISGGLREGMALYLQGVVPTNADQFEINFKTGPSSNDDMAFQFNPRMDQKVAMNSVINGSWGTEESTHCTPKRKLGACPHMGCVSSIHQVYVNGKELYTFQAPYTTGKKVSTLNINGDVAVNLSEILQPVQNPNLPYVAPISGGLREGMALYLQGVVPTNADQFEINFKTGPSSNDDMAFQFNPRMDQKVAMNSVINGSWGTEESVSENPFNKGEAFEMLSVIKSEGFQVRLGPCPHMGCVASIHQVYVNGKELYTFKHRIPLEKVSTLNINGDVAVNLSGFLQNLPYVAPISGGLREGMALYLQGVVPTNADQFEINFKTGPSSNDDMAFQFNPRMDQKVAMNSVINGSWGTEESVSENPFNKGRRPCPHMGCVASIHQVYVNGKELYTFKHRIPLEKVSTLNISGDVAVNLSGFLQNWSASVFPTEVITKITTLGSSHGAHSTVQSEILQPVRNPNLPYVAPISGGLREGMALYLKGVVPTNADQFEINFKTGPSSNDDMAFQFHPRMDQKLAMNSIINGSWGTEESVSDNPFKKGEAFEMFTVIKSEGYQVYVNGKELYTFKHRIPLEKVSTLNINGDVAVNLSEILQPVQNPNLPYVAPISGGLREGMALYLQGVVPTNADQFEINFKTGPSSNDDMAFQFNPRMDQKLAMNSIINGSWGTEESVSDNPFKKGEAFEMFTVIKSEGYQVYVNGKELYTFKHRIPLEKVSTLNISGDVAVNLSGFIQNWSASVFPTEVITKITTLGSTHGAHSTVQSEILQPVQNPNLPYVAPISGGLREGMALYLKGVVPTNADQFEINFKTGPSSNDDMAFQFNPRMDQKLAMNSIINGSWGTEESVSDNPFKKGEAFEMFSVIKSEGYQVYVNGKELYTFKHRIPLEKVSTLNFSGDVAVNLSGFLQNWSASVFPTEVITEISTLGSSHGGVSTVQSEILQPVRNPTIPYMGPISGGLREGMALYLQGAVPANAERFRINFKTGPTDKHDTAFHFNPRMGSNVAMNSFSTGKWETGESVSDNPFKKGEAFEMFFVIKSEGYQVYVNGKELYTFKHRIPLEKVTMLNINGDVGVNLFGFIENWSKSSFVTAVRSKTAYLGSPRGELSTIKSEVLQPIQNLTIPYMGPISGGLREGMALYLQGAVPANADRFRINFKTGPTDKHDTAFHFNPRMGSNVAMNSFSTGKWETGESVSDNPFKKGEAFEMFFVIKSEGYQVYVNGKELYTFKHRIPLEKVTTLNINGDIAVNLFGFIENWSKSSFVTAVRSRTAYLGSPRGELSTIKSEVLQPIQNPTLPYVTPIPGGLRKGMALYIQGVIPTNAGRFEINFKTGPTDKNDIAFHFNPRMGSKVVMNSLKNGKWGAEESVSDSPFKKGEAFEMFFVVKSEGYQVCQQHCMFKHRIPLEEVNTINIYGNVSISFLGFVTVSEISLLVLYMPTIY